MLSTDIAQTLAEQLAGDAFAPDAAQYDEARTGFVAGLDLRPALVALPESAEDVAAIVDFARAHGLRVAPQGTGHNAAPLADLSRTILLKTERMRGVTIDAAARVARVEAGAWWIDVSEPANEHGLAPLAGSSPDVGVVGYTLGGGASWLVRKHGLSANSVVAIEVVTADGRLVRCDHVTEPDLFWALRGGGGSFGVVTAIEIRLYELDALYAGVMFFPLDRASEVLKTWRALTRTFPDEVTSIGRCLNVPPIEEAPEMLRGKSFVTIEAAMLMGQAEGERLLQPLRDLGPLVDMFAPMPPIGLARLHMDPEGQVPMTMSDTLSLTDAFDDAAIDSIVAVMDGPEPSPLVMYEVRHVGGAAGRSGADHGAIDTLPGEFLTFGVGMPMAPGMDVAIEAHLARIGDALAPYAADRAFSNFTERDTDAASFFAPDVLARLQAIRAQVDPERMFQANHEIA